MAEKRRGPLEDLGACGRIDARVDPHDPRARLSFDGDQEPTARDVERQRPNEDRLALLEPGNDGGRDADRPRRLGTNEIDAWPGEGQPERSHAGTIRTRPAKKFSLSEAMGSDSLTLSFSQRRSSRGRWFGFSEAARGTFRVG
jgi:hypothetical protein